jgi:hypothetical protein
MGKVPAFWTWVLMSSYSCIQVRKLI